MSIGTEEMMDVAQVFQESYEHVMGNLVGELREAALRFTANVVLSEKPYMLVSEEGIGRARTLVFGHEAVRDFVFVLSFTFFSRWARNEEQYKALCQALAMGVAQVNPQHELNAVPPELGSRLPESKAALQTLDGNRWLVIVLLLQLFISIKPQENTNK